MHTKMRSGAIALVATVCVVLSGCASQPLEWTLSNGDPAPADTQRLATAKQHCEYDAKLKKASRIRADAVAIARYEKNPNTEGTRSKKVFDEASAVRQEVWDCMKQQGFVPSQKLN